MVIQKTDLSKWILEFTGYCCVKKLTSIVHIEMSYVLDKSLSIQIPILVCDFSGKDIVHDTNDLNPEGSEGIHADTAAGVPGTGPCCAGALGDGQGNNVNDIR